MEHVIVEAHYPEPTTPEALLAGDRARRFCFDLYRSRPVTHYLAVDDRQVCCVFRAPDAETVRLTNRRLDMPFEAAWAARVFAPDPASESDEPVD